MELSVNNGAESVSQNNIPAANPANEQLPAEVTPKTKKKKCSAMYAASLWRSTTARVDPHRRHNGFSNTGTNTTPELDS